jgi:hypothetical protein
MYNELMHEKIRKVPGGTPTPSFFENLTLFKSEKIVIMHIPYVGVV